MHVLSEKGYYCNDRINGKLIHAINIIDDPLQEGAGKDLYSLSQKEIEFLKLVCSDLTYKEIADKMSLSPHTIDGYRDNLFEKLNVKSRVGLVLYGVRKILFIVE
jgi:DNA-binding CsgD family transcriptional regulator